MLHDVAIKEIQHDSNLEQKRKTKQNTTIGFDLHHSTEVYRTGFGSVLRDLLLGARQPSLRRAVEQSSVWPVRRIR